MLLRIGALGLIGFSAFIALGVLFPETVERRIQAFLLTSSQKALFHECEKARQALTSQKTPARYATVEFNIRDERLKKDPILNDLAKCFPQDSKSPIELEIELFSSDYENQASNDLQVQISALDKKTKNKIAETGFRLDHEPIRKK